VTGRGYRRRQRAITPARSQRFAGNNASSTTRRALGAGDDPPMPKRKPGRGRANGLEQEARQAAATADVVVLVFDDQTQKQDEFDKVAAWVRDLGTPVIAVLNCRNPRWRYPRHSYSRTAAQRRNSSRDVSEHVRNIRDMLGGRGLVGVPIVALNAQRAVFGRARAPFLGPALQRTSMDRLRAQYGVDRLVSCRTSSRWRISCWGDREGRSRPAPGHAQRPAAQRYCVH
jgi:hypothetical protein